MIMHRKPWHLSAAGSALILFSTAISGYWIYGVQNRIDDSKESLSANERVLAESYRERDQASMVSTIALLQNKLAKNRTTDKKVINAWDDVLGKSLMEANVRFAVAAGKETDSSISGQIWAAMKAALNGDGGIASYDVMSFLLKEGGKHQDKLKGEMSKLREERKALEKWKNKLYFAALICQVIGIVLLLLKETPVARQNIEPEGHPLT